MYRPGHVLAVVRSVYFSPMVSIVFPFFSSTDFSTMLPLLVAVFGSTHFSSVIPLVSTLFGSAHFSTNLPLLHCHVLDLQTYPQRYHLSSSYFALRTSPRRIQYVTSSSLSLLVIFHWQPTFFILANALVCNTSPSSTIHSVITVSRHAICGNNSCNQIISATALQCFLSDTE